MCTVQNIKYLPEDSRQCPIAFLFHYRNPHSADLNWFSHRWNCLGIYGADICTPFSLLSPRKRTKTSLCCALLELRNKNKKNAIIHFLVRVCCTHLKNINHCTTTNISMEMPPTTCISLFSRCNFNHWVEFLSRSCTSFMWVKPSENLFFLFGFFLFFIYTDNTHT